MTIFQKSLSKINLPRAFCISALAFVIAILSQSPAWAQTPDTGASGFPLPRFVSLRSDDINMRRGPGQRYDVSWNYKQAGLPVEIIQESDNWRKVRDSVGGEGWVHKNLLSGRRTALVTPWSKESQTTIYRRPQSDAEIKAHLKGYVLVSLEKCLDSWCQVSGAYRIASSEGGSAQKRTFKGWIAQDSLWGVYPNELID